MVKMFYKYTALANTKKTYFKNVYRRRNWLAHEQLMTGTCLAPMWHSPCAMDPEHCLAQSLALLRVPTCFPWALRQRSLLLWPLQPLCSCRVWQLDCIPAPCQPTAQLPEGCCWQQAATLDMKWQFINNHFWVSIIFSVFDFFFLTLVQIFDRFLFYNFACTVSPWWLPDQLRAREASKKNLSNCCKFGTN